MADHNLTCPVCGEDSLSLMTVTVERLRVMPNLVNTTADTLFHTDTVQKKAQAVLCNRCEYAEEISDLLTRAAAMETNRAYQALTH